MKTLFSSVKTATNCCEAAAACSSALLSGILGTAV